MILRQPTCNDNLYSTNVYFIRRTHYRPYSLFNKTLSFAQDKDEHIIYSVSNVVPVSYYHLYQLFIMSVVANHVWNALLI